MEETIIQTAGMIVTANTTVKATNFREKGRYLVYDISFKNVGDVNATVTFSGAAMTLNVGDPMKSLGGYPGCVRSDEVPVTFDPLTVGVNPKVEVYFTIKIC